MELRATHAQPIDARFYSTQPLLGDAVERPSLGRNRGMGAGCRREVYCAGPIAGHVGREQLKRRARQDVFTRQMGRVTERLCLSRSGSVIGEISTFSPTTR